MRADKYNTPIWVHGIAEIESNPLMNLQFVNGYFEKGFYFNGLCREGGREKLGVLHILHVLILFGMALIIQVILK